MSVSKACRDCATSIGHHPCPFPRLAGRVSFARGQHLYHQGDDVVGAFSLKSGMVALERLDSDGGLVVLKVLSPGAFFPCADLMGQGLHECSARALTDVEGCLVPIGRMSLALRDDPQVSLTLLKLSSMEIRRNEEAIVRLCRTDLAERLMAALMDLAEDLGTPQANGDVVIALPVAWRDMAAMVGTGPEVISRVLRRLSDAGRLTFRGRNVTLCRVERPEPERACV